MKYYGRGTWLRTGTKPTLEHCRCVTMQTLRCGDVGPWGFGFMTWRQSGLVIASLHYQVLDKRADDMLIVLNYNAPSNSANVVAQQVAQQVTLKATRPHFGGSRWWFRCRCDRRVSALYLRDGYFACRSCHSLRYFSSKQGHREERFLRALGYDFSF